MVLPAIAASATILPHILRITDSSVLSTVFVLASDLTSLLSRSSNTGASLLVKTTPATSFMTFFET
jgi:hypothetical protein